MAEMAATHSVEVRMGDRSLTASAVKSPTGSGVKSPMDLEDKSLMDLGDMREGEAIKSISVMEVMEVKNQVMVVTSGVNFS